MHWDENKNIAENVTRVLVKETHGYFSDGHEAMEEGVSWRGLHEFRLHTKRFRYTLELFEDLYSTSYADRMDKLKEIQKKLGDINDAITTRSLLKKAPDAGDMRKKLR